MKTLNVFLKAPILMIIALSFLLQGCFAVQTLPQNAERVLDYQTIAVNARTVAFGITQALADKPGTQILVKESQYLFVWTQENVGTATFGIDMAKKTTFDVFKLISDGGQISNFRAASDLTTWMKNNGWVLTAGSAVEAAVATALTTAIESITNPAMFMIVPLTWDGSSLPDVFQLEEDRPQS